MVLQHGDEHEIPAKYRRVHLGNWLPADHRIQHEWLRRNVEHVDGRPRQELIPVLQEFREFIETNPRIFMYFTEMWDEVPHAAVYRHDPTGGRQIRSYEHMLQVLHHCFSRAPEWTDAAENVGMVGVPLNAIFDYAMGTPSGHAAFLDPDVNRMLKKVLNEWGRFLKSPESAHVLGTHSTGWFGDIGYKDLMEVANAPYQSSHKFEDMFVCDPTAKYYGFTSWDDFFTRKVHDRARPVAAPGDDAVVANACESAVFNVVRGAKLRDKFWIKRQPYSVLDMLAHDPLAQQFANATVYQAFLSALSYHRWHAPVSGTVRRAFVQDGTYFSEPLFEGVGDPHNAALAEQEQAGGGGQQATKKDDGNPIDVRGISVAQGYLTALATRAVIFFDADNADIGLMAFVGVGMDEVSTCEITVREGQHVNKGDEIGMFHFGGSSHVLLFREGVQISGFPQPHGSANVPVRGKLATVTGYKEKKTNEET
ncbi:phosphatidylserine decarboxylase family protein [Niveomyces insectorum RCEF 264]|uniref:Phosphatidylserine decarboxylase family protein n=1 Tax=Niveomyces insectorum RCEF 264 TaxID=1081102 RepID=A0A167SGU8_9HYPO|nr:phosphatidylserine decarboxylase family protein [Niveomyces insectorum RCEF 264]